MAPLDRSTAFDSNPLSGLTDYLPELTSNAHSAWKNRFAGLSLRNLVSVRKEDDSRGTTHLDLGDSLTSLASFLQDDDENHESFNPDEALNALHRVQVLVDGIFSFLNDHGVAQASMDELVEMESRLQYTALLKRAETYVECILLRSKDCGDHPDILGLFVKTWESLHEYSQDRYQQIQKAYSEYRLQQWQKQVTRISAERRWDSEGEKEDDDPATLVPAWEGLLHLSETDRRSGRRASLQRQQGQQSLMEEEEAASLRDQWALAVRFKMECQKNLLLAKEWERFIQRFIHRQTKHKAQFVIEV